MADVKSNTPAQPEAPAVSLEALTAAFAAAMQQVQPPKKTDPSEYMRRPDKLDPVLKRPVFQHGQPVQIRGCSQATIDNLDNLVSGLYLDDMVQVDVRGREPNQEVYISYTFPFADKDRRMTLYSKVSSFSDMVSKIAAEQRERTDKQ